MADKAILLWNNGKHTLDVYHGANDNVATFYLSPGYKKCDLFCQECDINYDQAIDDPIILDTTIVSEDEGEDDEGC